jgi:hypothetical protein
LDAFVAVAHKSVIKYDDPSLTAFLDGIFDHLPAVPSGDNRDPDQMVEQQAASTLNRFSRCDGADCLSISDFLLFLLGCNPNGFWDAMRSSPEDTAKWFSQLSDSSFTGEPADARDRENVRRYLIKRISIPAKAGLESEKAECLQKLNSISFRSWQ